MSKRVLVISGSYRKGGNSDTLCDEFIKGATASGNNIEKINLREKKIEFCTGCYACQNTGKCIQKDDVQEILDKMEKADVIVMATPIYFYTMCGQMKTLIDRTVSVYGHMSNKDMYFIMTAFDSNKNNFMRTLEEFRGFMDCYSDFREKGVLFGTGVYEIGAVKNTPHMKQAYDMGKNI